MCSANQKNEFMVACASMWVLRDSIATVIWFVGGVCMQSFVHPAAVYHNAACSGAWPADTVDRCSLPTAFGLPTIILNKQ